MKFNPLLLPLLGALVLLLTSCTSSEIRERKPSNLAPQAEESIDPQAQNLSLEEDELEIPPLPQYQSQEQSFEPAPEPNLSTQSSNKKMKAYFEWPVDEAMLSRGFFAEPRKMRKSRRKRAHLGLDLAARKGTAIYASHDGTIIYAGRGFKSYGRMIMIEGKNGWATLYAHLSKSHVFEGQKVYQGQRIGDMGNTGRSTGPHLHFEIRTLKGPVNPLSYLPNGANVAKLAEDGRKRPQGNLSQMGNHEMLHPDEDSVY